MSFYIFLGALMTIGVLHLSGCKAENTHARNLQDFYIDQTGCAGQGMVYIYESTDPGYPPEYWHFRYIPGYRGNYFYATMHRPDGEVVQSTKERFVHDGSDLLLMELYFSDSLGKIGMLNVQVNESRVFPFASIESAAVATSQVEYIDPTSDSVKVILSRVRTLEGKGEYMFDGNLLPACYVSHTEVLETETEGFTNSSWVGTEIYVQNIGLVYYKKEISTDFVLEYRLTSRTPFAQFSWPGYDGN